MKKFLSLVKFLKSLSREREGYERKLMVMKVVIEPKQDLLTFALALAV